MWFLIFSCEELSKQQVTAMELAFQLEKEKEESRRLKESLERTQAELTTMKNQEDEMSRVNYTIVLQTESNSIESLFPSI